MELSKLLGQVKPDRVVALTTQGTNEALPYITSQLSTFSRPLVLVGGFQEGHFSRSTLQLAHEKYRIDSRRLEAATVVARLMYDFETAIGLERFQT
jgi:rRNA pseudouridine-1189 N-methylase Emg1 (Nep1/Mra1 family)